MDLVELGMRRQSELEKSLSGIRDPDEARARAADWLEQVCMDRGDEAPGDRARLRGLLTAAAAGLDALRTVNQVEWLPAPGREPGKSLQERARYVPAALCALAAAGALVAGEMLLCLLCAVACFGCLLGIRRKEPRPPECVQGRAMVDRESLVRHCIFILAAMEDGLKTEAPREPGGLEPPLLEAVQMLLEARLTGDPEYALKGIPTLVSALNAQGIELLPYSTENHGNFDLLPAPEGGKTIRPALRQGDTLLMRGQATVKV